MCHLTRMPIFAVMLMLSNTYDALSADSTPTAKRFAFESTHYPSQQTAQSLYDELDYQRAVQLYIWAQPLVGLAAMAEGARRIGIRPTELFVFDQLVQVNQQLQTANNDVLYSFSYFNLHETGPLVIVVPPGNQYGVVLDAWQRPIEDLGRIGPDAGRGGTYLILPPGYKGEQPEGYIVRSSMTNNCMLFLRAVRGPGESVGSAVDRLSETNLYPYAAHDAPRPSRMHRVGDADYDGLTPHGIEYFNLLAKRIGEEPGEERDRMMLGMLATLGMEQGKPFTPDSRLQHILAHASQTGRLMVANLEFNPRTPRPVLIKGTQWRAVTALTKYTQELGAFTEIDERAALFRFGFAMHKFLDPAIKPIVGKGAAYTTTFRDGQGRYLDGSRSYRLRVPPNAPVLDYWSVSAYDADTFSFVATDQRRPSLSSLQNLARNPDGSFDLYFGPIPPNGTTSNWIKSAKGRGYFLLLRLFAPTADFYAGAWPLGDMEEMVH